MFSRESMIAINYIAAGKEIELDSTFIYVDNTQGLDYFEFHNFLADINYVFQIQLPESFPFASPSLLLVSPKQLQGYQNDKSLDQLGASHNFHINGLKNGSIDICYASTSWKPNSCVSLLILKAIVWCAAYSRYLEDGRCIDVHLKEIRREIEEGKLCLIS